MTDDDKQAFAQAFNRLAVATRLGADAADPAMKQIYWQGLSDLSLECVVSSGGHLERTAEWFPKVSEWRSAARVAAVALIKALPSSREEPWQDECGACWDTGWEQRRCYPGTYNTCGRKQCKAEGNQHTYAEACTCRPTNRTYARHHKVPVGQETYA